MRETVDQTAGDQYDFSDIRPGQTGAVHVPEPHA